MTTAVNDTVERYTIAGVGPYAFSFRIFDEDELTVIAITSGVPATLTGYTVTGVNARTGGTITLSAGDATAYAGSTLDIRSNTALSQPTSLRNQGSFLPEIHEDALDRLSRQIQDLNRRLRAAPRLPEYLNTDGEMSPVASWLSRYLYVNASGQLEPAANLAVTTLTGSLITSLLTGALLGQVIYPRAPAEITAGVTPSNYAFPFGHWCRYGVVPGAVGNQSVALQRAIDSGAPRVYCDIAGDITISTGLIIDRPIIFAGSGGQGVNQGGADLNTTRLIYTGAGNAITVTGDGAQGHLNVHLRDFLLNGTSAADGGIILGTVNYVSQSSIKNVACNLFSKVGAYGIRFQRVLKTICENVYCRSNYDGFLFLGTNTTVTLFNCYSYANTRYGYNVQSLISGSFEGRTAAESNGNAGLYLYGDGANQCDFFGYYSEANCTAGGAAPIIITGSAANTSKYHNFFGGVIRDPVAGTSFALDYAERIEFWNPTLESYGAGFITVTANTSICHFYTHNTGATASNVTGNAAGRMLVSNGATPSRYTNTLANGAEAVLPFTGGIVLATNITSNKSALIAMNGSANTTTVISDPDTGFANVGTGGRIGLFFNSGSYRVVNNVGSTQSVLLAVLNTDGI
jgi:hypothetical protein